MSGFGYAIAGLGAAIILWVCKPLLPVKGPREKLLFRKHRTLPCSLRALPGIYYLLAGCALLGGLLYAPNNYDGLTYRIPRVLDWLTEGQWHWIHTPIVRMNDRSTGFEWLTAPLLLFTKSDRLLFLINWISFLLLPGLLFSVFRQLGVRSRVAWWWMWLLPTGYNFVLQAGSIGNDTFAIVYALTALHFALRARETRRFADVMFSLLAAALLTGSKPGNLPLLLPWALALLPSISLLMKRPLRSASVCLVAVLVSFLPTALLNWAHCGDWTGFVLEPKLAMKSPVVGVAGNSLLLLLGNLVPPVFPLAGWWNHSGYLLIPSAIRNPMDANFEAGYLKLGELPMEEGTGLGFGVTLALLATILLGVYRWWCSTKSSVRFPVSKMTGCQKLICWSGLLSLLVFFSKSGMTCLPRLVSVYYPFIILPILITPGAVWATRHKNWRKLVVLAAASALLVVVVTPARPLWPAQTVTGLLQRQFPGQPLLTRAQNVYATYQNRSDALAPLRQAVPEGVSTIGFLGTEDDTSISFWRPYGQRAVKYVLPGDTASFVQGRDIEYVIVSEAALKEAGSSLQAWLTQIDGQIIAKAQVTIKVSAGATPWYLVQLRSSGRPMVAANN